MAATSRNSESDVHGQVVAAARPGRPRRRRRPGPAGSRARRPRGVLTRWRSRSIGPSKTGVVTRVGHAPTLPNRAPAVAHPPRCPVPGRIPLRMCAPWPGSSRASSPPVTSISGNYLGAFRQWVAAPARPRRLLLRRRPARPDPGHRPGRAAGRGPWTRPSTCWPSVWIPRSCTLFVQSHVPEHPRLAWLLECTATMGELRRMTQFKDKGAGQESVRVGLFTYPVLMAADILLYDADRVPVGDDQRQHLELTRDLADPLQPPLRRRPSPSPRRPSPTVGARVMDLQHPERKMSKSVDSPARHGRRCSTTRPSIERKVKRAVTDTDGDVALRPGDQARGLQPARAAGRGHRPPPAEVAAGYTRYGDLKRDVAEALVELLRPGAGAARRAGGRPRRGRTRCWPTGRDRAHEVAAVTYERAAEAIGPPARLSRGRRRPRSVDPEHAEPTSSAMEMAEVAR